MESRGGRIGRITAWACAATALMAGIGTAALAAVNHASIRSFDDVTLECVVLPISFSVLGTLLATRRPRSPVGWLLLFIALDMGVAGLAQQYSRLAQLTSPGRFPWADWAQWLFAWSGRLTYPSGAAALLFLLLPDGRLPSRRWRPVAFACLAVTPLTGLLAALNPQPLSTTPSALPVLPSPLHLHAPDALVSMHGVPAVASALMALLLSLVAASAPFVRLRGASGETRQQLKWIAFAVLLAMGLTTGLFVIASAIAPARAVALPLSTVAIVLGFGVAFPAATAIAILKHRLYGIDAAISRTVVYGSLAVLITAAYVGIVVGMGSLIGTGGSPNVGMSLVATTVVAVGFQPARERLQRAANRLVHGTRATPYEVLSRFSQSVAETYAVDEVLPVMARVLAEGTDAARADVWLVADGVLRPAASWPEDAVAHVGIPLPVDDLPRLPLLDGAVAVRHRGELLGALSVEKRAGEAITPIEDKLLADLAHQAGLVLRNVRLTAELLGRIDELRSSRQRLVTAQDEERRRLERNLHDGAQQHLVALRVKLGMAETIAARDPGRARQTIEELKADADEALAVLRDLSHGIYPPLLAARGLVTALDAHGRRSATPVEVRAEGVERYGEDTEACVYFCCLEALQNVQKHSGAGQATVELVGVDGAVRFEVRDNGRGFDTATVRRGGGLGSLRDRVDALGGRLELSSTPGEGTVLAGEVPAAATMRPQRKLPARKTRAALTRR